MDASRFDKIAPARDIQTLRLNQRHEWSCPLGALFSLGIVFCVTGGFVVNKMLVVGALVLALGCSMLLIGFWNTYCLLTHREKHLHK